MRKPAALCILLLALLAAKAAEPAKVVIKDLKYTPAKLTIKAGDTVVWINNDDNDHTVTSDDKDDDKPLFASDNLGHGDKYTHTFAKAGKFAYHCKYHPRMKGLVIVSD